MIVMAIIAWMLVIAVMAAYAGYFLQHHGAQLLLFGEYALLLVVVLGVLVTVLYVWWGHVSQQHRLRQVAQRKERMARRLERLYNQSASRSANIAEQNPGGGQSAPAITKKGQQP